MSPTFVRRVALPVPAAEAFAWHERPGAFERLAPPWQRVTVLERAGGIRDGARVVLRIPPGVVWSLEHRGYRAGAEFRDVQRSGPFARYEHVHAFADAPHGGSVLEDRIAFALPGGPLGALGNQAVDARFDQLFRWRHRITALDLALARRRGARPLRVAITGASGMIGTALAALLQTQGHAVLRLVRRAAQGPGEVAWDPARGTIDAVALDGLDAVVNLAGAGIADRPWSVARKREIVESRTAGTGLLACALALLARPPRVLVSASAIGWYGDGGDAVLDEQAAPGAGFLGETCRAWEEAAAPALAAGIRVVHPRIGIVLSPRGGALAKLLLPFRLGAGGSLGSGRQWWSWITLDDVLLSIEHALHSDALRGAFAAVAPEPVRVRDLAGALGRVLGRPALVPAPAVALRAVLGREFADAMLLAGQRVHPHALLASGFAHRDAELEPALRRLLGRVRE